MTPQEQISILFAENPLTDDQTARCHHIRTAALGLAQAILDNTYDGHDQSTAIHLVHQALSAARSVISVEDTEGNKGTPAQAASGTHSPNAGDPKADGISPATWVPPLAPSVPQPTQMPPDAHIPPASKPSDAPADKTSPEPTLEVSPDGDERGETEAVESSAEQAHEATRAADAAPAGVL